MPTLTTFPQPIGSPNQRNQARKKKVIKTGKKEVKLSLFLDEILKEMGIPDHLTCLLINLCAGQEATVRTGYGTTDWFQIGKGVRQGLYCHPAYLTYMQSTS